MSASVSTKDTVDSIVCAPSRTTSPRAPDSPTLGSQDVLTRPPISKSGVSEITKLLEIGHPLKAVHMSALLACYPSPNKATMLQTNYFDMSPTPSSVKTIHKPLPGGDYLAALQHHRTQNHWSLVRIHRDVTDRLVMVRHYDPVPCADRRKDVERVMKAWAKNQHPGWDVKVLDVYGPKAPSSALSGLYVVLGADELPVTGHIFAHWKPKSPQNAVVAALERYERATSADSGVSMDEDNTPKTAGPSGTPSVKRSDAKKGIGIGTAKRSKGSLVRTSLSAKSVKPNSPVSSPKTSPVQSEQRLPQSEKKRPSLSEPPQSRPRPQPPKDSSRLKIISADYDDDDDDDDDDDSQLPTPSGKRPRSETLEGPSKDSQSPVKKRCTPKTRDSEVMMQGFDTFLQELSFPSSEEVRTEMESNETAMMGEKTRVNAARRELQASDEEFAKRAATHHQYHKEWKELSDKITQDEKNLESWFSSMPSMNTMSPEQCAVFRQSFEANLAQHRKILMEKHRLMQNASNLLRSAEQVCDANKAKVEKHEALFAEREGTLRELAKKKDMASLISEFGSKLDVIKTKWEEEDEK